MSLDRETLATIYAALIISDEGLDITADKIQALLTAAKVRVEPFVPPMFARALAGVDMKDLIQSATKVGAAPAASSTAAAQGETAAEVEEEVVEEEEVEEDLGGFDLFGDDDDW
ncbi:hypothetical protein GEMRC1_011455 [Eukaryota sp. GEM-RC1]